MDIPDITITVPPIDGFSILFPGYINNLDNARALLPSEEQLAQGREAGNCNVTLRWRPNDPLSHPLVATEHTDKQLLVLKIEPHNTIQDDSTKSMDVDDVRQPTVVRAVDEQEVEVAVAVTTVACCGSVYTFDNMADFQYVGVDVRPEEVLLVLVGRRSFVYAPHMHGMCTNLTCMHPPRQITPSRSNHTHHHMTHTITTTGLDHNKGPLQPGACGG